jgi:hygromycin-B 4-O-kinase
LKCEHPGLHDTADDSHAHPGDETIDAVSQQLPLDLGVVRTFLSHRFGTVVDLVALEGGEWSRAFGFRTDGRDLVVKLGSTVDDYQKDRVAASWRLSALPVPDVIDVGETADGMAFAISERVYGSPLEELDRAGWRRVLSGLFGALAAMRTVDLPGEGFGRWLPDGSAPHGSWREWLLSIADEPLDPRIRGWRERLASVPGAQARFDRSYARLAELVGTCPEVRHVIHGDLTARNVLVRDGRVSGVLDWANSIAGDPLYDVAWLLFWAPWHPGLDASAVRAAAIERFQDPDFDARVHCYGVHIGLDAQLYNAFTSRWNDLEESAARTLEVAAAGP